MIIELHAVQSFGPANLNRDDHGAPKTVVFGGATRARVSSQSWKRAIRKFFSDNEAGLVSGTRTAQAAELIASAICKSDDSVSEDVARARGEALVVSKPLGLKFDEKRSEADDDIGAKDAALPTKQLIFFRDSDIEKLAAVAVEHGDEIDKQIGKASKGKKAKAGPAPAIKLPAEAMKEIKQAFSTPDKAVDVALFGRMIAELPSGNVDAACQVAHAIGTNRVTEESDFYTAVDDLKSEDTEGATMVGEIDFNSSCLYRYANIDTEQLAENLGVKADSKDVSRIVSAFAKAFVLAIPSGKQNTFAAHNPPSAVLAVKRDSGSWNLANAFVSPVAPQAGQRLTAASIEALLDELSRISVAYAGFDGGADAKLVLTEPIKLEQRDGLKHEVLERVEQLVDFVGA